jgi:hypothetical protein
MPHLGDVDDDDSLSEDLGTNQKDALHTPSPQLPDSCNLKAFELLLQCLGLNGDGATTLSLQVPSNV